MEISVSDIRNFLRCRRRWDLTSPNRQGLEPVHSAQYFFIGEGFHRCLEEAVNLGRQLRSSEIQSVLETDLMTAEAERYAASYGFPLTPLATSSYEPLMDKITDLVLRYQAQYGDNPLPDGMRYLKAEAVLRLPIPGTRNTGWWRGTIDGVALNERTQELVVVEHKTYSRPPSERDYQFDDQIRIYCWALEQATGHPVAGALYDGMSKKEPTVPRLLQSGELSRNMSINTDVATYMQAIRDNGLDVADYWEHLQRLEAVERSTENPFFTRFFVPTVPGNSESVKQFLREVYEDMARDPVSVYPHRPWNGCSDCGVRSLCDAMTLDEDLDYVVEDYTKAVPYGTFNKTATSTLDLEF